MDMTWRPEPCELSFHNSLHQLRQQLDEMNARTAALLPRDDNGQNAHSQRSAAILAAESLYPPSGPAFWKLYRSLSSDLRGVEARVELVEDRIENISSRLEALEPFQFTPPGTPEPDARGTCHINMSARPDGSATTQAVALGDIDMCDIGHFDPSLDLNSSQQLATSDVITFIARLRRTAQTKRIVHMERFLRGAALHLYTLGYNDDGINDFNLADGCLDLDAFEAALLALYRPKAVEILNSETFTLADLHNKRRLVEDYAFRMLDLGRYLNERDTTKKRRLVYASILRGIHISAPFELVPAEENLPNSLPAFLAHLHELEDSLKRHVAKLRLQQTHSPTDAQRTILDVSSSPGRRWSSYLNDGISVEQSKLPPIQQPLDYSHIARELPGTPVASKARGLRPHDDSNGYKGCPEASLGRSTEENNAHSDRPLHKDSPEWIAEVPRIPGFSDIEKRWLPHLSPSQSDGPREDSNCKLSGETERSISATRVQEGTDLSHPFRRGLEQRLNTSLQNAPNAAPRAMSVSAYPTGALNMRDHSHPASSYQSGLPRAQFLYQAHVELMEQPR